MQAKRAYRRIIEKCEIEVGDDDSASEDDEDEGGESGSDDESDDDGEDGGDEDVAEVDVPPQIMIDLLLALPHKLIINLLPVLSLRARQPGIYALPRLCFKINRCYLLFLHHHIKMHP